MCLCTKNDGNEELGSKVDVLKCKLLRFCTTEE